jgi:hypothetical protein
MSAAEPTGRALSPLPARIVLVALAAFVVAERGWGSDEQPLLYFDVFFAAALGVAAGLALLWRGGGSKDAARYATAVVLTIAGMACALGLYALAELLTKNEAEGDVAGFALVASLSLFAIHAAILVAIELVGAPMRASGFVETRRVKQAASTAAMVAFAVTGLALLNVAAVKMDKRWDLSLATRTRPTDATLSLLKASEREVELYLFFEKGSPVLTELGDYFDALTQAGMKRTVLDQALDAELAKELKVSRNGTVALKSGDRSETWFVGTDRDAARRKLRKVDEEIRTRLSKLTRDAKTIYFTTGHGERGDRAAKKGARPAGSALAKLTKSLNAKVKKLGLAEGLGTKVPDDADVVVVLGPTSGFLEGEAQSLAAWVDAGGALLIAVDPGVEHGLDDVLERLGVEAEGVPLVNDKEFVRRSHTDADHEFLFAASFASHKAVKALNDARGRVALLFLRTGALNRAKVEGDPKPKVTFIARSRKDTFADKNGDRKHQPDEKRAVKNYAAAVERPSSGEADARAVVVADSDVLGDALVVAEANTAFAYESMLWLLRDDAAGGAVESDEDVPIVHTRDDDALWFYGSTFVAPGLVLFVGLMIVRRRRRRRTA